ncbi:MAG: hypothetical protein HYZ24_14250 [Chloroflexi bacterium]|nr:hypothetical protein [Chloroflexota bacterium]
MEKLTPNETSPRQKYSIGFIFLVVGAFVAVMAWTLPRGVIKYEDNLVIRNFLIEKTNFLRLKLGDRVFPRALVSRDGWMEFTGDGNLNDYQNSLPFDNGKNLAKRLKAFDEYLRSQGITLLIVVAPNKATIYPDKLPKEITKVSEESRLEQFETFLQENNLPAALNLAPALKQARKERDVYYRTNTHWNGYGAYVAYVEIINALSASHPELKPYALEDLNLKTTNPTVQDIPELLRANYIKEENFFYTPKEDLVHTITLLDYFGYNRVSSVEDDSLPTLLMIHDSFGYKFLNDYLAMNFRESHFIHGNTDTPAYLYRDIISQFDPDIIVIQIVERGLNRLENYFSSFDAP